MDTPTKLNVHKTFFWHLGRSSHRRCSLRKGVLRKFAKFTRKHLCQSSFFNKVAGLRPATLLKKRLWHRCFPMNFAKIPFWNTFSRKHLRWLSLSRTSSYYVPSFKVVCFLGCRNIKLLNVQNAHFRFKPHRKNKSMNIGLIWIYAKC